MEIANSSDFSTPASKLSSTTKLISTEISPVVNHVGVGQLSNIQKSSGKIYQYFDPSDDIITNVKQTVTEVIWSTGTGSLAGSSMFFNPTQISASVEYYLDAYCYNPVSTGSATPQFAFGFADKYGRGTDDVNGSAIFGLARTLSYQSASYSPTAAMYSQYRNLLLPPGNDQFTMNNGIQMNSFYFINISRNRLKERLDAGNWELTLTSGSDIIQLIDNAGSTNATALSGDGGHIYSVISGSINNGPYLDTNGYTVEMGLVYPDLGIILINASGSAYVTESNAMPCEYTVTDYGKNNELFKSYITQSTSLFQARNSQNISSTYYFVRIKHNDYNFSNNGSFVTGTLGDLRHPSMINNPNVYITTVGLYNNANELLAVAKLSQPLKKNFEREALIRVKLNV